MLLLTRAARGLWETGDIRQRVAKDSFESGVSSKAFPDLPAKLCHMLTEFRT